ncbi:MAG TPA: type II and III secretion system protein family protein [Vicinamibacterales bacterium]|nr:type II and III secretion system protein family protein [Vicinamibacterales bacterium]
MQLTHRAIYRFVIIAVFAAASFAAAVTGVSAQAAPAHPRVELVAGRSTVLTTDFDVTRIAVTNPAIADAVVVQPREILIDGKAPGTISLIVWGGSSRTQYDVVVEQPTTPLEQQLHQLFPAETIQVATNADAIILSGRVSSTDVMLRAAEVAKASAPKSNVINMMTVPGGAGSQQVMLQVRFAEVNRRALMEVGASFFTGIGGYKNWTGRTTTQQFPAPDFDNDEGLVFSDFLNLFLFNNKYNVGTLIKALKQNGYFQSLAEPNLIAYNGQEASFLAGGEFPIPFVSGGLTNTISIVFKEFGVRLKFRPTIAGDLIRLHVAPEVSSLDFNNGILLEGFRIPAITARRAETEVELRDGQSFAIAGLINNESQNDVAALPILSQLPIIGNLFKSKAERKERTELLVIVTPRLVRPLNPDEVPPVPTLPSRFLPAGDDIGEQLQGGGGVADAPAKR